MAKGVYTVQNGYQNPKPDSSFYSCATALLIFLILCIVLITAPIIYKKISDTSQPKDRTGLPPVTEKIITQEEYETHERIKVEPVLSTQLSSTKEIPVLITTTTHSTTTESETREYVKPSSPDISTTHEPYGETASSHQKKLSTDEGTSTAYTMLESTTSPAPIIISVLKTTPTKETKSDTSDTTTSLSSSSVGSLQFNSSTQVPLLGVQPLVISSTSSSSSSLVSSSSSPVSSSSSPVSSSSSSFTERNLKVDEYMSTTGETISELASSIQYTSRTTAAEIVNTDGSDMSSVSSNSNIYTTGKYYVATDSETSERLIDNRISAPNNVTPADISLNTETSEESSTGQLQSSLENENSSTLIVANSLGEANEMYSVLSSSTVQNNIDEISSSIQVYEAGNTVDVVASSYTYDPTEILDNSDVTYTEIPQTHNEEIEEESTFSNYSEDSTTINSKYEEYFEYIENNTDSSLGNRTSSTLHQVPDSFNSENMSEISTLFSTDKTQKIEVYSYTESSSITTSQKFISSDMSEVSEFDGDYDLVLNENKTEQPKISDFTSLLYESETTQDNINSGTCESNDCKVLASRMLSFMNHSTDPCSDFYEFACGGLRANEALLEYDPKKDVWRRIHDSMKKKAYDSTSVYNPFAKFYDSCMSYDENVLMKDRIIQARAVLDSVGQFHDNSSWANNTVSLTDLIYNLLTYHSAPLFDVLLDVDGKNPSKFAVKLVSPFHDSVFQSGTSEDEEACRNKLDLGRSHIHLNDEYEKYLTCTRTYYLNYLKTMDKALKGFGLARDDNVKDINEIRMLIEFHILVDVKESLPRKGEMRRIYLSKEYELMTISELQGNFSLINWQDLFSRLLMQSIETDAEIQVYFKVFLTKLFNVLTRMDNRLLYNALLAMFAHDLYVDLVQTRNPCDRAQYCLRVASSLMEDLSSGLYLETFSDDDLQQREIKLYTIFSSLKNTLRNDLKTVAWLDDISRENAILKLESISMKANGGKHVFNNEDFLRNRIDVKINSTNYLNNSVELLRRYRRIMYYAYDLNPKEDETIWTYFILPYSTEAIAIYGTNTIVIPIGILTEPIYHTTYSQHILISTIGFVVAQEMFHHFDTVGIQYGANGRFEDYVLSYQSMIDYDEHISRCWNSTFFSDMNIVLPSGKGVSFKLELLFSLNERLADEAAVQLALQSHSASRNSTEPLLPWLDMNWKQLYFLSLAQTFCTKETLTDDIVGLFEKEHLPPPIRVNKIMENSQDFSEAFSCPTGTKMNPVEKCDVFPHLSLPQY